MVHIGYVLESLSSQLHFTLYIPWDVVLKRCTVGQQEHHFELPKQQCLLAFKIHEVQIRMVTNQIAS